MVANPMTTRPNLTIDRLISELETLAQISTAEPPVVTRVVFSEADLGHAPMSKACARQRDSSYTKMRSEILLRAGKVAIPLLRPSGPARTSTPSPTPAPMTESLACWAVSRRFASCSAWISSSALNRTGHLHRRGADPLRHRLPGQPHDGQRARSALALWHCAISRARPG